jgi:hypothetical protein
MLVTNRCYLLTALFEKMVSTYKGADMDELKKEKWYNNRAKVIFSLQAFPPLGIYALLRSTAFTAKQKWLVALGVTAFIGFFIYSGIGAKMNQFVIGLFT